MSYNNHHHHHHHRPHFNNNNFHNNFNRRGGAPPPPHHFHQQQRFHNHHPPPQQQDHSFRGGRDEFPGSMDDRKRPFPFRDAADNGGLAKLFIGSVPSRATEGDVRPLFEKYGNVIEVIFIMDKRTGRQQECCFVKYASVEEAERAIKALDNQYILPGENTPIQVRYATKEREHPRPFSTDPKLYVADLNNHATEKEIEEIFSPYGRVEDIHIMRNAMKQSRGTAFVQLEHRDMAEAAMNALNGKYVMQGCVLPLTVRFAEPKRHWGGRPRLESHHVDPHGGNIQPNSRWRMSPENVGPSSKINEFAHHSIPKDGGPVSTHMKISVSNSHSNQTSGDKPVKEESTSTAAPPQQTEDASSDPCIHNKSPSSSAQDVSREPLPQASSDNTKQSDRPFCEWSEHICPDGENYYYNCLTKESRWEKPNVLAHFQKAQRHNRIPVS